MPAQKYRIDSENTYYHLYNKGREGKILFNDANDYNTFIGYLNEYLTEQSKEPAKKVFTVQGKTFSGVPHLPKNYHKKLELVAYSLIPSSFNLIVKQIEKGSLTPFIRSLSTRYSIYFNKKYKRNGQLFDGQCKSMHLENNDEVTLLTYYLHKRGGHSSISKYIDSDLPEWASNRTEIVNYTDLIQKYVPSPDQNNLISRLMFNNESKVIPKTMPSQEVHLHHKVAKDIAMHQRVPEMLFASVIFLTLLIFGLININVHVYNSQVAGISTEQIEPTPVAIEKQLIKIPDKEVIGTAIVNSLDTLSTVSIYSDIERTKEIVKAVNGVKLELVSSSTDWSEVKLSDNVYGFIETKYIKI